MSRVRQVNLYHESLHPPQRSLTVPIMAGVIGGTFFLMLGLALGHGALLWWIGAERDTLAEQVTAQRLMVTELADQVREQSEPDPAIAQSLEELEEDVQRLHRLRDVTAEATSRAKSDRLSEYLRALGRQMPSGAWLVQMHLDPGGTDAYISGYAEKTEAVPELIEALGWEPAFSGMSFHTVKIEDPETARTPNIRFRLTAGCEGQRCAFPER